MFRFASVLLVFAMISSPNAKAGDDFSLSPYGAVRAGSLYPDLKQVAEGLVRRFQSLIEQGSPEDERRVEAFQQGVAFARNMERYVASHLGFPGDFIDAQGQVSAIASPDDMAEFIERMAAKTWPLALRLIREAPKTERELASILYSSPDGRDIHQGVVGEVEAKLRAYAPENPYQDLGGLAMQTVMSLMVLENSGAFAALESSASETNRMALMRLKSFAGEVGSAPVSCKGLLGRLHAAFPGLGAIGIR